MNIKKVIIGLSWIASFGCFLLGAGFMLLSDFPKASCFFLVSIMNYIGVKEVKNT